MIELPALKDYEGNVVTTATVTATVTFDDGSAIPSLPAPLPMPHKGAGKYEAVVPPLDFPVGTVVAVSVRSEVAGVVGTMRELFKIQDRGFSSGRC